MAFKDDLRTQLLAQSSITTLAPAQTVQGQSYSGIFVDKVKQGFKPPYIVIERNGFDPLNFTDAQSGAGTEDIDVTCVEQTEPEAEALATAVTNYLKAYIGTIGSTTGCAVTWRDSSTEKYEEDDGRDVWRYEVTLNFSIFHP